MAETGTGDWRWSWARIAALVALFVAALLVRTVNWPLVFLDDGILFTDGDSYYHLWRILHSVQNFPEILKEDPFVNFPHGGDGPWPPGFDWVIAASIRLLFGSESRAALEVLAVWLSPVLGALNAVLGALLVRRHFGETAGWLAGALLCVLPGTWIYTQLGFFDHHAAIAPIGTLLLGGTMAVVAAPGSGPRAWPWLAGGLVAAALLTWAGALLHILVLQGCLVLWVVTCPEEEQARSRAIQLALAHAVACALLMPFCLGQEWGAYGSFTPMALSSFQPAWYGAGALCLAVTGFHWRLSATGGTKGRRQLSALVTAVLGLGLAVALIPDVDTMLSGAARWFSGGETFHERIGELQPLFGSWAAPTTDRATSRLTYLIYALPLAGLFLALYWPRRPERWVLLAWTAVFAVLVCSQVRFINTFSVAFCLVWASALGGLAEWVWERWRERKGLAIALTGLGTAWLLVVLSPAWEFYEPTIGARFGEKAVRWPDVERMAAFKEAGEWLGRSGEPVSFEEPEYGTLVPWGLGHLVRYYSGTPMVQDGFGPYVARENVEQASRYFAALDEATALDILSEFRVRYLVMDGMGAGRPEPYEPNSMTGRMYRVRGSAARIQPLQGGQPILVPALGSHRLVYETRGAQRVQVWEVVAGARVAGRGEPGTSVVAELLVTIGSLRFSYRSIVQVDPEGRYTLRLPYPTEAFGTGAVPAARYELRNGERMAEFTVSEDDVRAGASISGPDFY